MKSTTKFIGLDVSKATLAVATADQGYAPPRYVGSVPNTPEAVRNLVKRLGKPEELVMCYEAGTDSLWVIPASQRPRSALSP